MLWTPRVYQGLIHNFGLDRERGNIFASPGTGKTSAGVALFDTRRMLGMNKRCLVIAPKRVAKNVWPAEIGKWHESFGHLNIAAAVGTAEQRIAAIKSKPDILCINYEMLEWLIDGYGADFPFDMMLLDESTRVKGLRVTMTKNDNVKGQGSVRAKALATVAHKQVRTLFNLTGSPAPNGVIDLYGQQWFIDGGRRLGHTFKAFEDRWFYCKQTKDGYTQRVPFDHAQPEIEALMKDCSITIDARDYFDIKEPLVRNIMVDLPPKARAAYLSMEKELFADIEKHAVEVFTSGGKANKCLQIANGSVFYDKESNWVSVHDEKIEALKSLAEELNGEPLLVRYQFRPDRERILKAFPRARFLDDKKETEDAWNRGEIPMLVCHAASAGHGLSLQHGGRVLVDYSSHYDLEHDEQVIERLGPTRQLQSGYDRMVYRYRLIARDTIEETSVLPRLLKKMSVQDSFKEAMKHRC